MEGGVEGEVGGEAGEGEGAAGAPPCLPPGGWEAEVPDNLPSEELAFPDVSRDSKAIEVPDTLPREHDCFDDRLPESSVNFLEFMGEESGERESPHPPTELDSSGCPSSSSSQLAPENPEFPSVDPENRKTSSPVKERAGEGGRDKDPRLLATARPLLRRQLPALFGGDVEIISDDETSDLL